MGLWQNSILLGASPILTWLPRFDLQNVVTDTIFFLISNDVRRPFRYLSLSFPDLFSSPPGSSSQVNNLNDIADVLRIWLTSLTVMFWPSLTDQVSTFSLLAAPWLKSTLAVRIRFIY